MSPINPFWVLSKGWRPCAELRPGDLLSSDDGQLVAVEAVADTGEVTTVYNLCIAEYHTYFVGSEEWGFSVWAHNAKYQQVRSPNHPQGVTWSKLKVYRHTPSDKRLLRQVQRWRAAHHNDPGVQVDRIRTRVPGTRQITADGGVVARFVGKDGSVTRANWNPSKGPRAVDNLQPATRANINAQLAWEHAEGQAMNAAGGGYLITKTNRVGQRVGILVTDVEPCLRCGANRGIVDLAREMGLDRLRVISPSGTRLLQL